MEEEKEKREEEEKAVAVKKHTSINLVFWLFLKGEGCNDEGSEDDGDKLWRSRRRWWRRFKGKRRRWRRRRHLFLGGRTHLGIRQKD